MKLLTEKTQKQEIVFKKRNFNINIADIKFELDVLQVELIKRYIRQDMNFKRAYFTDWTNLFFQFLRDKRQLNEPLHLSMMGSTRSGKSVCGICVGGVMMESSGKLMSVSKILASEYVFLQTLKENKNVEFGDCFVIDESKQAVFGIGSQAKKLKIQDVQNIIAVNNISTIWIKPDGWAFDGAMYGLRSFGRGQYDKFGKPLPARINRFMLYNLQETGSGGSLPLGMVYIPHFADYLENGKKLWEEYSAKKQEWVNQEQSGQADSTMESMFKLAEKLNANTIYSGLKKGNEKEAFVSTALGSEATRGEVKQIVTLTKLLAQGYTLEMIRGAIAGS